MRSALHAFVLTYLSLVAAGLLMALAVALIFADEHTHLLAGAGLCVLALIVWSLRRIRRDRASL